MRSILHAYGEYSAFTMRFVFLLYVHSWLLLHHVFGLEALLSQHLALTSSGVQERSALALSAEAYSGTYVCNDSVMG